MATAFDLHVLGTPPALILSQDQTLKLKIDVAPSPRLCSYERRRGFGETILNARSLLKMALLRCLPSSS